jgi:hypothetical protein
MFEGYVRTPKPDLLFKSALQKTGPGSCSDVTLTSELMRVVPKILVCNPLTDENIPQSVLLQNSRVGTGLETALAIYEQQAPGYWSTSP